MNMEKGFSGILTIIIGAVIIVSGLFVPKVVDLFKPQSQEVSLGADATLTIAGTIYTLSGSGVSGSATSIGLASLTIPQTGYEILDADVSATFYVTLEPGSRTRQELVSCTTITQSGSDTTATLSGCTRGLLPISPYTASSPYQFAHGGGTSLVFSNPPQLYEEFAARGNAETITGIWTFSSTTIPRLDSYLAPTLDYQFAPKKYADDLAIAGVADGNYSTFGGFILATTSQVIAGTATSTATRYLVLPSELSNTTSSAKNIIPVTKTSGKLSQGFWDLTEGFTFSDGVTSTATTSLSNTTIGGTTTTISSSNLNITSGTSTFINIPILPASNPTTGNQAVRKTYADLKTTGFSATASSSVSVNTDYYTATSGLLYVTVTNQAGQIGTLNLLTGNSTSTYATSTTVSANGASAFTLPLTYPILPNSYYKTTISGTGVSGGTGIFFPFSY